MAFLHELLYNFEKGKIYKKQVQFMQERPSKDSIGIVINDGDDFYIGCLINKKFEERWNACNFHPGDVIDIEFHIQVLP